VAIASPLFFPQLENAKMFVVLKISRESKGTWTYVSDSWS